MENIINSMEKVKKEMGDNFFISVPCKPEYVSVVRLTASAIASRIGFTIEEIEDIKVAIAEACTNSIKHGLCCENFDINFLMEDNRIVIDIIDRGNGFCSHEIQEPDLMNPKEGGLGIFIIRSLMDEVEVQSDIGKGTKIKMIKYLGEDL